jgi:hypothetical protein
MRKKSVISLISYDASYLAESIKTYYNYVDEIKIEYLGVKINFRLTKMLFGRNLIILMVTQK